MSTGVSRRELLAGLTALAGCKTTPPARTEPLTIFLRSAGAVRTAGLERLAEQFLPEARRAATLGQAGFLLIGSGPAADARADLAAWDAEKPFALFGVSVPAEIDPELGGLLGHAAYLFAADTVSLQRLRATITGPVVDHVPDAAFGFHLRDDEGAKALIASAGITSGGFLAITPAEVPPEVASDWRRETGLGVLTADPAWPPELAASVYRRATAVLSAEPLAAILALINETAAVYIQAAEDESGGQAWKDIGLRRWIVPAGTAADEISERLLEIHREPAASQADAHEAVLYARKLQADAMTLIRRAVLAKP